MSAGVALAILQTSADDDVAAALGAFPAALRCVVRPPELAALPVPPGVDAITSEWRGRADVARIVRRATGATTVVVLDARERPDAALAGALAALDAAGAGVHRARRRHRFLGGDVVGEPVAIAWCEDREDVVPALLAGTLIAHEGDVTATIARIDLDAARGAAGGVRGPVPVADFVRRPVALLLRRWWLRRHDGVPGMILSLIESFGAVLAAAKRWERKTLLEQHLRHPAGMRLPRGFVPMKTPFGWLVVRRDVDERLLGTLLDATPATTVGTPIESGGRGGAFVLAIGGGRRAVLRWYRRGGAFRGLLRDRYFGWRPRPIRELVLTEEARRRGVAAAEVLGVRVDRAGPGVYRGVIVTSAIEHATTLADVLRGPLAADDRAAVLDAVARVIRSMHARGVHHRDLNTANILVTGDHSEPAIHLIDFDRAQIRRELPDRIRRRALRRLDRSLAKLNRERQVISFDDRVRLVRAYWGRA